MVALGLCALLGLDYAASVGGITTIIGTAPNAFLVAFVNGLSLFLIAAFSVWEAVHRLLDPVEIMGPVMLAVAVAGGVVLFGWRAAVRVALAP